MTTPDEMKRAVERMAADLAFCTAHVRLLLSGRAELLATVERMRGALAGLIRMNEEHNAAVEKVMGRPLNWSDNYLNEARAALTTGEATTPNAGERG